MADSTSSLQLNLLGPLHLVRDGVSATSFRSDAQRVLLAYLALNRGTPQRRDALAALLTPDRDNKSALKYLRNRLERLRHTIGDRDAQPAFLFSDRKIIGLENGDHIEVDAVKFSALVAAVRQHQHRTLIGCQLCADRLQAAAELWRGELLDGLNYPSDIWENWLYGQRGRLKQEMLWVLATLAERSRERADWSGLLARAQRQLALEPWLEEAHAAAIEAQMQLGERRAALAQFARCKQLLWDELGVEPSERLAQLIEGQAVKRKLVAAPINEAALHNLPLRGAAFFGRKSHLTQIESLLGNPHNRLVTVTGLGGVGKTRLAQEAGRRLLDSFPDGVWWVPLASLDDDEQAEDQIATQLAQALDYTFTQNTPPLTQLIRFLREAEALIILDNLEQVIDVAADVVETLLQRTRSLALLCTSREALNLGDEFVVPLAGFSTELVTTELFAERAQRAAGGFMVSAETSPQIMRIGELVGGSPLGLELAASWTRTRSLAQIVSAIEESADFLATRRRDVPKRHRSMRAVFNTSWALLEPGEQRVFAKLTVFRGRFSRAAARAVADATQDDLDILIEKSLLERDGARYQVQELLRQFGAEQRPEERPQRFVDWFIDLLEAQHVALLGLNPLPAARLIEEDERNIWLAWQWALDATAAPQLQKAFAPLAEFYFLRGRHFEGEATFRSASELATLPVELGHALRSQYARFLLLLGRLQPAIDVAKEVSGRYEPLAQLTIGEAQLALGQLDDAAAALRQAQASDMPNIVAQSERKLGVLAAVASGDFAAAEQHFAQAMQQFEAIGHPHGIAWAQSNLGSVAFRRQQFMLARQHYEQAHAQFLRIGHIASAGTIQTNLGGLFSEQHNYVAAEAAFEKGHVISEKVGDALGEATLLASLGWVSQKLGKLEKARALCADALERYAAEEATLGQSKANNYLGVIAYHGGDFASAQVYQERALAQANVLGNGIAAGYAQLGLALAAGADGYAAFSSVLEHANENGLEALDWEARAGLALLLAEQDLAAGQALFAPVLKRLNERRSIHGVEEPGLLYWAACRLSEPDDAAAMLAEAWRFVTELASQVTDEAEQEEMIANNRFFALISAEFHNQ